MRIRYLLIQPSELHYVVLVKFFRGFQRTRPHTCVLEAIWFNLIKYKSHDEYRCVTCYHFAKLLHVQDPVLVEVRGAEHFPDLGLGHKLRQPLHGGPELVEADRLFAEVPLAPRDPPALERPEC